MGCVIKVSEISKIIYTALQHKHICVCNGWIYTALQHKHICVCNGWSYTALQHKHIYVCSGWIYILHCSINIFAFVVGGASLPLLKTPIGGSPLLIFRH